MREFVSPEGVSVRAPRPLWKHRGVVLLFLFTVIGVLTYPFHLSQDFYAVYVVVAFFILAMADLDFSFLVFLFLTQAFLGESDKPYLYLIDLFVLALLVVGFFRIYKKKNSINFREWWIVLPFLVSIMISFPLCLKEIMLDYRVWGWGVKNFLKFVWISRPIFRVFWFKEVLWTFTAFGLYLVVSENLPIRSLKYVKKVWLILCLALISAAVFGLILYFYPVNKFFLSLSFKNQGRILTSFGWNIAFFSNYAVFIFPFLIFLIPVVSNKLKVFLLGIILICLIAAVLTVRRGMIIALFVEIVLSIGILSREKGLDYSRSKIVLIFLLAVFTVGILFNLPKFKYVKHRFIYKCTRLLSIRNTPRYHFYEAGLKMVAHEPIFGMGSGGFSRNFSRYDKKHKIFAAKASTHSVYLKMLSERGIFGLLAFLWLIGNFLFFGFKKALREQGVKKLFLMATVAALFGEMIVYGLVFDPFYLRVFEIMFWCFLAFIAVLASPVIPKIPFTKKKALAIGVIFVALFGYRLWRVKAEPISEHYEAGFYRWEIPRKGKDKRPYRLTSGHALKVFTIKGDSIRFRVCSNKPDVNRNPQVVNIYLNGKRVKTVELKDRKWEEVEIPVAKMKGEKVFMDIHVGGTWIPYKYGRGKSRRELGVIMSRIRQERE